MSDLPNAYGAWTPIVVDHKTTTLPVRVQRRRVKGWRMPPNTVYVGRGSRFGNPIEIGTRDLRTDGIIDAATAVERFSERLATGRLPFTEADVRAELRGKNLACWCPLDQPCHAAVLMEIANA